jgi:hypothetical protein
MPRQSRHLLFRWNAAQTWGIAMLCGVISLEPGSPARAQYTYNPANADEQEVGIRYFGAAKDTNGALVPGATIMLSSDLSSYVFVTDEQGRFRGSLPLGAVANKVTPKCFKAGFQAVQVTKRPGPPGVKPTVQVDCVLRPSGKTR